MRTIMPWCEGSGSSWDSGRPSVSPPASRRSRTASGLDRLDGHPGARRVAEPLAGRLLDVQRPDLRILVGVLLLEPDGAGRLLLPRQLDHQLLGHRLISFPPVSGAAGTDTAVVRAHPSEYHPGETRREVAGADGANATET